VSVPVEGGRPIVKARVFGFPVRMDLSFVLIMGVLGFSSLGAGRDLGLWILITPFAVLVHELGHAVTARTTGAAPQIALTGFGGVTVFRPPDELSRWRSLGISLAGPAVGLVVGVVLLVVRLGLGDGVDPSGWVAAALAIGVWTCLGWSVLNLLPVLPLDGGQAMRELLPGKPMVRARRAAAVSVVVALVAAVAGYLLLDQVFLAFFLVFFALSNWFTLRRPAADTENPVPEQVVVDLLWQGRVAQARQAMESLPPTVTVDLAVHGAVLALTGDPQQGRALLDQELRRRPDDQDPAALLTLTLVLAGDWDGLVDALREPDGVLWGPDGIRVPGAVLDRALAEAGRVDRGDVVDRITLIVDGSAS
jgi:Zn-dependent protease